MLLAKKNMLLA